MDEQDAAQIARTIEAERPELTVAGIRRVRVDGAFNWTIDVIHRGTGRMTSLEEKDLWRQKLDELHDHDGGRPSGEADLDAARVREVDRRS